MFTRRSFLNRLALLAAPLILPASAYAFSRRHQSILRDVETSEIGTILRTGFSADKFTEVGSPNISYANGVATVTANTIDARGRYVWYSDVSGYYVPSEDMEISVCYEHDVYGAASYGAYHGLIPASYDTSRGYGVQAGSTTAVPAQAILQRVTPTAAFTLQTSANGVLAAGEKMKATVQFDKWKCRAKVQNLNRGGITTTAWHTMGLATDIIPTIATVGVRFVGTNSGTLVTKVSDFEIRSTAYAPSLALVIGDSIAQGAAGNENTRYVSLLNHHVRERGHVYSGSNSYDRTSDAIKKLWYLRFYRPWKVVLGTWGNNMIDDPSWNATAQAEATQIVNYWEALGAEVIILQPTPRNAINMTPLVTWLNGLRGRFKVIDLFNPLRGAGTGLADIYNGPNGIGDGDGVHPNDLGHKTMADIIIASGALN